VRKITKLFCKECNSKDISIVVNDPDSGEMLYINKSGYILTDEGERTSKKIDINKVLTNEIEYEFCTCAGDCNDELADSDVGVKFKDDDKIYDGSALYTKETK